MNTLNLIEEALAGNLSEFSKLLAVENKELAKQCQVIPALFLTKAALLNVLEGLKNNQFTTKLVQSWASFVIRGYITSNISEPIMPIQIDYEIENEDSIVDVLSRLDELGDAVDGVINKNELDTLIHHLS